MKKKITIVAITLACLTLAGCVSEGGYATYDRSYTRYEQPRYAHRDYRPRADWDRDRHDRWERDRRNGRRQDDRRDRHEWSRNDRPNSDWRGRDGRSDRRDGSPGRDGRVWVPDN